MPEPILTVRACAQLCLGKEPDWLLRCVQEHPVAKNANDNVALLMQARRACGGV
jgi:hypothetical protein